MIAVPIILFVVGMLLNLTLIGAIIGVPLCIISFIWFIIALVSGGKRERRRQEAREDERLAIITGAVAAARTQAAPAAPPPPQADWSTHPPVNTWTAPPQPEPPPKPPEEPEARRQAREKGKPPPITDDPDFKRYVVNLDALKKLAPDPEQIANIGRAAKTAGQTGHAFVRKFAVYILYVALFFAAIMFIPEVRGWVGQRLAESEATGAQFAAGAYSFVAQHLTVIGQSIALLTLAVLFVVFGKRPGIAGAVVCVLVVGYIDYREYVMSTAFRWLSTAPVNPQPTPETSTPPPPPDNTPAPEEDQKLGLMSAADLCQNALNSTKTDWDTASYYEKYVTQAKLRNFTIDSCRAALGEPPTTKTTEIHDLSAAALCQSALNGAKDNWDTSGSYSEYISEAQSRGFTIDACRSYLGMISLKQQQITQLPPKELCEGALNSTRTDWDGNYGYADYSAEARNRGLTIDTCRAAMGLPSVADEAAQSNPTVEFSLSNTVADTAFIAFFDGGTRGRVLPTGNQVYFLYPHSEQRYSVPCNPGQLICYGGWKSTPGPGLSWGLGAQGTDTCADCCQTCPAKAPASLILSEGNARQLPPTITWTINNQTTRNLSVAFYSETRPNTGWPAWDQNWTAPPGPTPFTLSCQLGERICYGAWEVGNTMGDNWGVGPWKRAACRNCCNVCNNNSAASSLAGR